jgi:hypothetical protein
VNFVILQLKTFSRLFFADAGWAGWLWAAWSVGRAQFVCFRDEKINILLGRNRFTRTVPE